MENQVKFGVSYHLAPDRVSLPVVRWIVLGWIVLLQVPAHRLGRRAIAAGMAAFAIFVR